jgi:nucleotide-binding universal stress UspA family protein
MWPIKIILLPTDFSACSQEAFRLACSLAHEHKARLIVLHVTSMPDLAYKGYGAPGSPLMADEYVAKVHQDLDKLQLPDPQVRCEHRLEEGDPASEIIRVAAETAADLIVMGTDGQTGLRHLLSGASKTPGMTALKTPNLPRGEKKRSTKKASSFVKPQSDRDESAPPYGRERMPPAKSRASGRLSRTSDSSRSSASAWP